MAKASEKLSGGNGRTASEPPPSGLAAPRKAVQAIQDASSVWLPPDSLKRWERNPRANDENVPRVAAAIKRWGFINPIVVWRAADRMVAGDTRLKAMRRLLAEDPKFQAKHAPMPGVCRVVFHDFENEAEADLYALADNRLGELAAWDGKRLDEVLARYDDEDRVIAGFEPEVTAGPDLEVHVVEVEALARETFWLTVRGPLPTQPDVLDKLRDALAGIEGVEVQIGAG